MTVTTLTTEFGGRTLTIETGRLARLAGGSVTVRYGDTAACWARRTARTPPGLDFFPLTVDFEERMYAAGKIPGGFIKRESRPSEAAILAARLTDRPIRPLFPEGYKDDVQIVLTVLSTDQENDPDILGTIAASAALTISEIPFLGPVGAVRVGRIDGQFVVNPTNAQLEESELDLVVSGTRDAIMMVEAGAKILPEYVMAEAIMFGHRSLAPIIDLQEQLRRAGRQGEARPVHRARHRLRRSTSSTRSRRAARSSCSTSRRRAWTPSGAQIVEIGAVQVQGGKIADRWSTLVEPGAPIVGKQLHGITDGTSRAPRRRQGGRRTCSTGPGDALLVGHNVGFDIASCNAVAARAQSSRVATSTRSPSRARRTRTSAPTSWPSCAASSSLPEPTHRALPDAEATAALLLRLGG